MVQGVKSIDRLSNLNGKNRAYSLPYPVLMSGISISIVNVFSELFQWKIIPEVSLTVLKTFIKRNSYWLHFQQIKVLYWSTETYLKSF